jgi:hypothetical protein
MSPASGLTLACKNDKLLKEISNAQFLKVPGQFSIFYNIPDPTAFFQHSNTPTLHHSRVKMRIAGGKCQVFING